MRDLVMANSRSVVMKSASEGAVEKSVSGGDGDEALLSHLGKGIT